MKSEIAMKLFAELLWTAALISAPILALTLIVGIVVSLFQAVTQIQDASLSFIPKVAAAGIGLAMFGPWMLRRLVSFSTTLIGSIPQLF